MRAWLAGLDDATRRSLRDDVTPLFKEIPSAHVPEVVRDDEHDEDPERLSDVVLEALRPPQDELFPELGADPLGLVMRRAREQLPDWQYRAFVAWARGSKRARIKAVLGVSKSTVRSALDGEGRCAGEGAIRTVLQHVADDVELREAVTKMAEKAKKQAARDTRLLAWFRPAEKVPNLVTPLAFLLLLDELADARREVKLADVLGKFPRDLITPCLSVLRSYGFTRNDGHTVKINKTPIEERAR